ncbi:MAG: ATP-dependent DNA helicase [Acidobacteria bacterium]|nr:ATP-dependent DNA helicase [Acidobacteriota bacterium]
MGARIDSGNRWIELSVGDLVEGPGHRAIGLGGTGLSRLWLGQELHRRVQEACTAAEPGYRAEVEVREVVEVDGWTVELSGRADGVVFDGPRVLRVDEIKTLHFAVDLHNLYAEERLELYRQQARLYAFMLSPPEEPCRLQLVLVDIATGEERREEVPWRPSSVFAWVRTRVHRILAAERRRLESLAAARRAAASLPFPHDELRPVQERIGRAVEEALRSDQKLLINAPTGCGKTAAVLHPVLRVALESGRRVLFLTAKTLQQRIAVSTSRAMQAGRYTSLQLRAKGQMCAHTEMVCHEEFCPYAREYGVKLARSGIVRELLAGSDHLDPDVISERARSHEICPFEVSLELLDPAHLVICDYNYVFDPSIGLGALMGRNALRDTILVIDEAHNLADRSRGYYSPELGTGLTTRAGAFLEGRTARVFSRLSEITAAVAAHIEATAVGPLEEVQGAEALAQFDERAVGELRVELDGAMLDYWMYKRENELWIADDPVMDLFLALTRFHQVLRLGGDELVHLVRRDPGGELSLRILCRDASRFIGRILREAAGTVAMSATLEPFEFYRNVLGFPEEETATLHVPSPFPQENRLVLALTSVDTTWKRRPENYDPIASWIARLAHPEHNVLVLFPSYRFLAHVHDRLPAVAHTVLRQRPGADGRTQREVLEALGSGHPTLLMAVLGGMFAEGVDYPGRMLSQVLVVSPGLPQFGTERQLLRDWYRDRYGQGFAYAYLIPGMTRVIQAAGRLIRSADDRGVIVLLGRRFAQRQYLELLPEDWVGEDPSDLFPENPEEAIRRFFEQE